MKQLSIIPVFVLVMLAGNVVLAEGSAPFMVASSSATIASSTVVASTTRNELLNEQYAEELIDTKTKIANRLAEMQKRKEERKIKLEAKQKERVQELFNDTFDGFEDAAKRLVDIDSRLNAKLESLKSAGKDISVAETAINAAGESLAKTMAQINATEDALDMAVEVGLSKEMARNLVSESKESIKKTRDLYKLAIETIKNLI